MRSFLNQNPIEKGLKLIIKLLSKHCEVAYDAALDFGVA